VLICGGLWLDAQMISHLGVTVLPGQSILALSVPVHSIIPLRQPDDDAESHVQPRRRGRPWWEDFVLGHRLLQKLVLDGYTASNVAGCDLRRTFIDIGFDKVFKDADTCAITFFTADLFDLSPDRSPSPGILSSMKDVRVLEELKGQLTHVYAGALFHLFDEETQYAIALRMALLLKVPSEGGRASQPLVIFGRHQGKEEAGVLDDDMGRIRYGHNASTWSVLWKKRVFGGLYGEHFVQERVTVAGKFVEGQFANGRGYKWFVWSVTVV